MQKLMKVGFKLNKKKCKLLNMKVFFFWGMPISAERLVLILKRQNCDKTSDCPKSETT